MVSHHSRQRTCRAFRQASTMRVGNVRGHRQRSSLWSTASMLWSIRRMAGRGSSLLLKLICLVERRDMAAETVPTSADSATG